MMKMRALLCAAAASTVVAAPQYLHLSLGATPAEMNVQWRLPGAGGKPTVQWGPSPSSLINSAPAGQTWSFADSSTGRSYAFALATMTGLTPGSTVYYRASDNTGAWSPVASFNATRASFSAADPLVIAWLGDMGLTNAQALERLNTDATAGVFDYIVDVG
jgi:hypothetical protein